MHARVGPSPMQIGEVEFGNLLIGRIACIHRAQEGCARDKQDFYFIFCFFSIFMLRLLNRWPTQLLDRDIKFISLFIFF